MTSPRKPSPPKGVRLHGSPTGEIGKALARSLKEARRAGRLPSTLSVGEVLATRMAGVADSAWRASDVGVFMTAVSKLAPLVRQLGLSDLQLPAAGGDDDGDDAGAEGDAIDRELSELVASGPTILHSKNA